MSIFTLLLTFDFVVALGLSFNSVLGNLWFFKNRLSNKPCKARIFFLFKLIDRGIKSEKSWGIVYDSVTKKPIDPATVTISLRENGVGEFKQTRITDINGRFSFLVTPGHYVITAEKTNYVFPSKVIIGKKDGKFRNIYRGEVIEVVNPYIINLNIPMDPVGFDWNQSVKKGTYHASLEFLKKNLRLITIVFGAVLAAIVDILSPVDLALIVVGIYIFNLLFVEAEIVPRLWGTVFYRLNHEPVPSLEIKAIRMPYKLTVATAVSDYLGRYFLLLAQGKYTIQVELPGVDGGKSEILKKFENIEVKKEKEVVNFDIVV